MGEIEIVRLLPAEDLRKVLTWIKVRSGLRDNIRA